jgi:hypothetical protein
MDEGKKEAQRNETAPRLKNNAPIGALIFKALRRFITRSTRQQHSGEIGARRQASQSVLTGAWM